MGLNLGASTGGTSSNSQTAGTGTNTPTFSAGQGTVQSMLGSLFSQLLPAAGSGGISAPVQAVETGNANQINQTSAATGTAMNRFLASRGFGASGQTGQAGLQTELGRQAALGANASNAGAQQLTQNDTALSDALNFAFNTPGSSSSAATASSGSSTAYKVGAGVSV